MSIKEIIENEQNNGRTVSIQRDAAGIPVRLNVWYSSGTNQMSLPHRVATYTQTPGGWEMGE